VPKRKPYAERTFSKTRTQKSRRVRKLRNEGKKNFLIGDHHFALENDLDNKGRVVICDLARFSKPEHEKRTLNIDDIFGDLRETWDTVPLKPGPGGILFNKKQHAMLEELEAKE
jgi:hypothetical protein